MSLIQFAPTPFAAVAQPCLPSVLSKVSMPAKHLGRDEEIFAEGDEARFFYQITKGAVRTFKLLKDGRRQIDAFHLPGEFIGVEAGNEFACSAEALTDTYLVSYRRCHAKSAVSQYPELSTQIVMGMIEAANRAQSHMLVLGRKTALERIATFLGLLVDRCGGRVINLPMSRMDIADHLGLTIETVSRSMTELERRDIIHIPAHRRTIFVRKRLALSELAN